MARKRTGMQKIRDIIRFRVETSLSDRQIAHALSISRSVVMKAIRGFEASGLTLEALTAMSDSDLAKLLETAKPPQDDSRYQELSSRFPGMVVEMKKRGVTLQFLWELYSADCPRGYQYSQFCFHYQRWCDDAELSMHIDHKAGEQMFVDYAGDKLVVINGKTNAEWEVETFVAILGASQLTYAEASESQQVEDWVGSNERALRFMQGCPEAIVPDNLKSAVARTDPYEPGINPLFDDFALHYGVAIMPARVRKARDKALVENAVRLIYQRVYTRLRGKVFFSLQEINTAMRELVEEHNNRLFQRLPFSRRQLFEQIERQTLHALPAENLARRTTLMPTVQMNYHVELREDLHYYSVPHYLRTTDPTTKVKLVYDERVVAIYYDNTRIVQYPRDRTPNGYTTLAEHMPPEHRWYTGWSAEKFIGWARAMGPDVEALIAKVIESKRYAPQAFRVCLGILNQAKAHGAPRLNKACRKSMELGSYSIKRIETILAHGMEEERQEQLDLEPPVPEHENLRGRDYYN